MENYMSTRGPTTIATINFKGGVGKTTVTWCLADTLATHSKLTVLMYDLDAQMSLTQSVGLNEDVGTLFEKFGNWYENSITNGKTIFHAMEKYTSPIGYFDFPIGYDFIYKITDRLHFVPSVEDLYWLELGVFDREMMKNFIRDLLGKISNTKKVGPYDFCLFDCPPSFTVLSYSVLATCDLILIPVNPDYFAARGVSLILNSLRMRIEPHPLPKIAIFMNKAKTRGGLTKETQFYMREVERVCAEAASSQKISAVFFDSWVPDRVGIKRAITGGNVPTNLLPHFEKLWNECIRYLS
jgi:chromosome partitioning protein